MKPIFWVILGVLISPFLALTVGLYAQTSASAPGDTIPVDWLFFLQSMKGTKGISTMALTAGFVQFILYLVKSRFIPLPGKYKLLVMHALTLITGITSLKLSGFDWQSALVHSNTLGAIQVFGHQILKQFQPEREPAYELPPAR